jgi:hypothetical protein
MAGGILSYFYGGITQQAGQAMTGLGNMLGRGTDIGRNAADFWGKVGAKQTAAERTVEAFGLAGKQASREQVLSVYSMFKNMEELRASSRAHIEGEIGEKELGGIMKQVSSDFKFAVQHFDEVIKELGKQFRFR